MIGWMRVALNSVATVAPDWLRAWVPSRWFDRSRHRVEEYRLPKWESECKAYAEGIDANAWHNEVLHAKTPPFVALAVACL